MSKIRFPDFRFGRFLTAQVAARCIKDAGPAAVAAWQNAQKEAKQTEARLIREKQAEERKLQEERNRTLRESNLTVRCWGSVERGRARTV